MTRRSWLGAACGAFLLPPLRGAQAPRKGRPLDLSEYQPRSMLRVPEHIIEKPRFPVIDIHTHLSWAAKSDKGVPLTEERRYPAEPEELLPIMDRRNIRAMVNLTGGYGRGLREAVAKFDRKYPGRFYTFTEPCWSRANEPGYPRLQADLIEQAVRDGARGLKVLKTLGLYLRENITSGPLVKVDDTRFDPMWEVCGALQIPVAIHVSDPVAFFLPIDRFNERFEELNNHPEWSFYGGDFPSNEELLEARNRVLARHPRTQFIVLHVGNYAENLAHVSESMDRFPNMHVEIGARIGELGRQPRTARRFFDKYQDRILFGTDAVPRGYEYPQQVFGDELYKIYFRFLETEDEYFDYAPAPIPPQGRWKIYGLGLPDAILRKVYYENAARLLRLA
ncbi:MAG: amidohydrolase family protein [Bryobacterales bacterium]|nr:amidohydrolase [Bryobacteraceae bacterium]MDW8353308.1 amidohydrolase family protein [Bryobacterales bacterium]